MTLYCAIDLHSNNSVLVVIDEEDRVVLQKRVANELTIVLAQFAPVREQLHAVAVESTFNWYWLVDGLNDAGFRTLLVNPCARAAVPGA